MGARDSKGRDWTMGAPGPGRASDLQGLVNSARPGLGALASEVESRAVKLLLALHDLTGAEHTAKEEVTPTSTNRLQAITDRLERASAVLAEALAFVETEIAGKL